jgi:hypothetical protein
MVCLLNNTNRQDAEQTQQLLVINTSYRDEEFWSAGPVVGYN